MKFFKIPAKIPEKIRKAFKRRKTDVKDLALIHQVRIDTLLAERNIRVEYGNLGQWADIWPAGTCGSSHLMVVHGGLPTSNKRFTLAVGAFLLDDIDEPRALNSRIVDISPLGILTSEMDMAEITAARRARAFLVPTRVLQHLVFNHRMDFEELSMIFDVPQTQLLRRLKEADIIH